MMGRRSQLFYSKKTHACEIRFLPQYAIELDGMADGLVNLQAQLRRAENNSARAFGTLCGGMQRDSLLAGTLRVADKIKRFDQLISLEGVLSAEAVWIRALLNFAIGERGCHHSRAGLHFQLMNGRADARNKELINAAERHGAFGERHALDAAHFFVRGQQQINLPLYRNVERIFQERILPGVNVSLFRRECHIFALRERGGFGDGDCLSSAGLHAFARQPIRGGESPRAAGHHANADSKRLGLHQRADFPVLGGDVALADVHHARVSVCGAAKFRRFNPPVGPVLHHFDGRCEI